VPVCGIIFDLGWTLADFRSDIPAAEAQRARDLGGFLLRNSFELDGAAVYDSYRDELRALRQAGAALNYEYPARLAMLRALRRYVSYPDAARCAADALEISFESLIDKWHLYPDTLDTLATLRDVGQRLACISNANDGAYIWHIVDRCELRPWLSPIYISAEIGLCKPHPRIFERVLEHWELPPQQVVMVGDTLDADVLGAQNVGMRGVWIDRGPVNPWSNNEESRAYIAPDATIQQLAELPDLLANL
jgi:HAD superfamily phosphatase (TIGR01668 family)